MNQALRACAIFTGSIVSLCVLVSLSWWFDASWGEYSSFAVAFIEFMTGFLGFFVMFGMIFERLQGRRAQFATDDVFALVWKKVPRALLAWLALLVAIAAVTAAFAISQAGKWEAVAPYSEAPGCHWPLSTNHDTEHTCVGHARWLTIKSATDRIFFGIGAVFCIVDCVAFTTLAGTPRPSRRRLATNA